jgi:hypothetical protein
MLLACFALPARGQLVPEGIHQNATGPSEMCGISGRDARDLIEKARTSPALRATPIKSDRFELFVSTQGMDQVVVTRPGEPAYPSVTCRHVYQDAEGNWLHERQMRCEASREACDRLFIEFKRLDEQALQELRGRH